MRLLLSKPTTLWWNYKSMFRVLKYRVVHLMFTTIRLVLIIVNDKHSIIKIWTVFDKCTSFFKKYLSLFYISYINEFIWYSKYLCLHIKWLKCNTLLISLLLHLVSMHHTCYITFCHYYLLHKRVTITI